MKVVALDSYRLLLDFQIMKYRIIKNTEKKKLGMKPRNWFHDSEL